MPTEPVTINTSELSSRQQARDIKEDIAHLANMGQDRVRIHLTGTLSMSPGFFDELAKTCAEVQRESSTHGITFVLKHVPVRCREFHTSMTSGHLFQLVEAARGEWHLKPRH